MEEQSSGAVFVARSRSYCLSRDFRFGGRRARCRSFRALRSRRGRIKFAEGAGVMAILCKQRLRDLLHRADHSSRAGGRIVLLGLDCF